MKLLRNQYFRNLLATGGFFLLNMGINLWLTPFYINKLGVSVFGLLPLIISLTAYFGLITNAYNISVSRFLSIEINNQRKDKANELFNTSLFGSLLIVIALIPIAIIFSYYSNFLFVIPREAVDTASIFFFLIILSFLLTSVRANFAVSPFILNRLDIIYIIQGGDLLIRFLIIYITLNSFTVSILWVGIAYFFASIAGFIISVLYFRNLTPYLFIGFREYRKSLLRRIFGMSSWVIINQMGALLFLNIDIIVANRFFSSKLAGSYGSILQLIIYIRALANLLSKQFAPSIYAQYAKGNIKNIINITNSGVEIIGILLTIPIGLIICFSDSILLFWLGKDFVEFNLLLILLVAPAIVNLPLRVLFYIQQAYNKVKLPAKVTIILGVINLILAVSLSYYTNLGLYGIVISNGVVLTAKNLFFTPIYTAHIMGIKLAQFAKPIFKNILNMFIFLTLGFGFNLFFQIDSILLLLEVSSAIVILFLFIIFYTTSKESKNQFLSIIR